MIRELKHLAERYCVSEGEKFRLENWDPADTSGVKSKKHGVKLLEQSVEELREMQEKLYAQENWALLLVLQGMDASGKDGTIKHVMSGVNPEGCDVYSFKDPSREELKHDYLWRAHRVVPERGKIGIFNRSHYEEVLVVRVHSELLKAEKLPERLRTSEIWRQRYEDINAFELYLARNGVAVRKCFLHLSKVEQRKRFLKRLDDPTKNWKFSMEDVRERQRWDDYQRAYEQALQKTAKPHAPWHVVPADHKWYARLIIAAVVVTALRELSLQFPHMDNAKMRELEKARKALAVRGGN